MTESSWSCCSENYFLGSCVCCFHGFYLESSLTVNVLVASSDNTAFLMEGTIAEVISNRRDFLGLGDSCITKTLSRSLFKMVALLLWIYSLKLCSSWIFMYFHFENQRTSVHWVYIHPRVQFTPVGTEPRWNHAHVSVYLKTCPDRWVKILQTEIGWHSRLFS